MIVRVRVKDAADCETKLRWVLYRVPDNISLFGIFDGIHAQELEPKIDLSWCDPDTCKIYTTVTRKDIHGHDDLHKTSGEITIDYISEQNHLSIFNWKN